MTQVDGQTSRKPKTARGMIKVINASLRNAHTPRMLKEHENKDNFQDSSGLPFFPFPPLYLPSMPETASPNNPPPSPLPILLVPIPPHFRPPTPPPPPLALPPNPQRSCLLPCPIPPTPRCQIITDRHQIAALRPR